MKKVNLIALALIAGSLTACGSGGGDSAGGVPGAVDDALKSCGGTYEECVGENPQVWVWDEENYDSFAHQKMVEGLENWQVDTLELFERWTQVSISESSFTPIELADRWAIKYYDLNDSFVSQVKPYILSIYEDFGASTTPDQYLANSLIAIDDIRSRYAEHYEAFIEPKFYPYPEANDHLASLELLQVYYGQLDTIAVEISMEIN